MLYCYIGEGELQLKIALPTFNRAEVNGWWPGKVVNLMIREEGRAMAQVTFQK